jgi:hypothetical protein
MAWRAGLALLIVAPFIGVYPIFMMTAAVLRDLRLRVQPAAGLQPAAAPFGHAAYLAGSRRTPPAGW